MAGTPGRFGLNWDKSHAANHRASQISAASANGFATASEVDARLMTEVIGTACRRYPSLGQSEKTARVEQLIRSGAWTDAALALIDLELPFWQVRRLAYDDGEWYCALSRERELPDWLDQSIEAQACGSGARDPERLCRGPAHQRAGEPDQRAHREGDRVRLLRAGVDATISRKSRAGNPGAYHLG